MPSNKFYEVIKRLAEIKLSSGIKRTRKDVSWIIKRYLHYAIEAAIHGYPIKVYCQGDSNALIQLGWIPVNFNRRMWKRQRKMYAFSSREYGKMFYISITGKYMPKVYYQFYMEEGIKKRLEDLLNTDAVYQFTRK